MKDSHDCIFCKIASGDVEASFVYEDEHVVAFNDASPAAKIHLLFIHKKHTANLCEMINQDATQVLHIMHAISAYREKNPQRIDSFRLISNVGKDAGQSVFHTHFHVLAGEKLAP